MHPAGEGSGGNGMSAKHIDAAASFFAMAYASLAVPTTENKAAALAYGARALQLVALSDPDQRAHAMAVQAIRGASEPAA
jgi:hypothetical protein